MRELYNKGNLYVNSCILDENYHRDSLVEVVLTSTLPCILVDKLRINALVVL